MGSVVGIICEYNPLHYGHRWMLRRLRRMGADGIVCAMSGNFVQRGECAIADKMARAEMALLCGADLVLELPTPWAAASAETFARGGVSLLRRTGVVTDVAFGAECAELTALWAVADALDSPDYESALRDIRDDGGAFAARRQAAVAALAGPERAALLRQPNSILAVEYLRALRGTGLGAVAVPRQGAGHDAPDAAGDFASASRIRRLLNEGKEEEALALMPPSAAAVLRREIEGGRAPVDMARYDRVILGRLRQMEENEWACRDGGGEGLYHRLYQAVREARTLEELLARAGTKRYPMARLRRMVLAAWLGLPPPPDEAPYLRVLGANDTGRRLLRQMRGAPVLTKPADVGRLGEAAEALFRQECRWSDLYALLRPAAGVCGEDWRASPILVSDEKRGKSHEKNADHMDSGGADAGVDGRGLQRQGGDAGERGSCGSGEVV